MLVIPCVLFLACGGSTDCNDGSCWHPANACAPRDDDCDDVREENDNCPYDHNADQTDTDGDRIGDVCDNCPNTPNDEQVDSNWDGIGNACQTSDEDDDGIEDAYDNCPNVANPDQKDNDSDHVGNACDTEDNSYGSCTHKEISGLCEITGTASELYERFSFTSTGEEEFSFHENFILSSLSPVDVGESYECTLRLRTSGAHSTCPICDTKSVHSPNVQCGQEAIEYAQSIQPPVSWD